MSTKVIGLARAQAKIRAIGTVLRRPLKDVLSTGARLAAISCAKSSQPFGTGAAAQKTGQKAVARDIRKVYHNPGDVWADIRDRRWQSLFWRAYKDGEYDVAELIAHEHASRLRSVPWGTFDGGAEHMASRNSSNGRVQLTTPKLIVTDSKRIAPYVARRQNNVGFGKGGWADVARQLGSIRGLRDEGDITANWITRKASGLGRVARGGSDQNPTIVITSTVSYAGQILQSGARSNAIRIARERMLLNLQYAVKAEMRKLPRAA